MQYSSVGERNVGITDVVAAGSQPGSTETHRLFPPETETHGLFHPYSEAHRSYLPSSVSVRFFYCLTGLKLNHINNFALE